jgi:hypothetical protein
MAVSFLFFLSLSLLYPPAHPCGPARHAPPSRPPPSPTPPHSPPPPPSPTARAQALPSPTDLAAVDPSPPRPRAAACVEALRGEVAERRRPHTTRCAATAGCIADRAPRATNQVPIERIELRGWRIGFRSAVAPWAWRRRRARPPAGKLPAGGSSSPGGGGGHPRAVAVLDCRAVAKGSSGPRPCAAETDRCRRKFGRRGSRRAADGSSGAARRPGRRLQAVAGGSNGSNRGVGAPFSTRRRRGRRGSGSVNTVGGEVGALLDCNFLLAAPTFRVGVE